MVTSNATHIRRHQLLIAGDWVDALSGESVVISSPVTGDPVVQVASAGTDDVDRAVSAAAVAFERYRWRTPFERAAEMERVADVIDKRREAIAGQIVLEHGKPMADALGEVTVAADGFRLAAAEARRLTGETVPVQDSAKRVMTFRQPRGVWAAITPWNFPFNIPVEYVGPALASGNAVVLKPAPSTAGIAGLLAECIVEAGVPEGLFSLLTGPSVEMGASLVAHDRVIGVGFTGSSTTGRSIARLAGDKELILELGGNGPIIVLDDADIDRAIPAIGSAAFFNAGQSCTAAERVLAIDRVEANLIDGLTGYARGIVLGDPRQDTTTMGPVHNETVAARMDAHIEDARSRGARVIFGGRRRDKMPTRLYYEPTVVTDVPVTASVALEETFGPIAPITALPDDHQILAAANACELGLSSAVFTRDLDRAFWFAERLQTGQVTINDTSNYWELHLPFGGWAGKASGRGRVGGRHIFDALTQIRSVAIDIRSR